MEKHGPIVLRSCDIQNPTCAACRGPATYLIEDSLSERLMAEQGVKRVWKHGGDFVCAACLWVVKSVRLRMSMFVASERGGLKFIDDRGAIDTLLAMPKGPFVACWPRSGTRAGGRAAMSQTVWWESPPRDGSVPKPVVPRRPLWKFDGRQTAMFAKVNADPSLFWLQVDEEAVLVDVPLWTDMRLVAEEAVRVVGGLGVDERVARAGLTSLTLGSVAPMAARGAWTEATRALRRYQAESWWGVFVGVL